MLINREVGGFFYLVLRTKIKIKISNFRIEQIPLETEERKEKKKLKKIKPLFRNPFRTLPRFR